jgi:hypothetical protein
MQALNKLVELIKKPNYILIAAWVIPAAVLLTILYLNFLPFGYEKTLTINVGSKNDDKGEFRLEPSQFLGARQELDGKTFRYLDGLAYAVYEPKVVLNNATIEAELTASSGVSFILPPDLSNVKWDYDWNAKNIGDYFEAEISEKQIFEAFMATPVVIPSGAEGSLSINGTSSKAWAVELTWPAKRNAQLLTGDINLYQNAKELILKYQGLILKYPLPDYFLGETRTAIIGFDGKKLYIATDKNDKSTKIISLVIPSTLSSRPERSAAEGSLSTEQTFPKLTVSKTTTVQSFKLHSTKPSFITTKDDSIVLDGSTRLTMPNTADKFEDGPFTVYAEWTPEKAANGQQIIGHFNWEIWQNEKTISFQVGRMSTSTGPMYKISYNIDENFFNKKHTLLAVYSPVVIPSEAEGSLSLSVIARSDSDVAISTSEQPQAANNTTNGYIELFVDGIFASREYFANETIWKGYGNQNLSLGWTPHNYSQYPNFQGNINNVKLTAAVTEVKKSSNLIFSPSTEIINIPIYGTGDFNKIKIGVKK